LRVLVADGPGVRLDEVTRTVTGLGHDVIARESSLPDVANITAKERPDGAVVIVHEATAKALQLIDRIVHEAACPAIAVLDVQDRAFINEAAKRGIFAYIADGHDPQEMQSSIDIVLRRFAEYHNLEGAFARRAVTERAKGILMERHSIDEQGAFDNAPRPGSTDQPKAGRPGGCGRGRPPDAPGPERSGDPADGQSLSCCGPWRGDASNRPEARALGTRTLGQLEPHRGTWTVKDPPAAGDPVEEQQAVAPDAVDRTIREHRGRSRQPATRVANFNPDVSGLDPNHHVHRVLPAQAGMSDDVGDEFGHQQLQVRPHPIGKLVYGPELLAERCRCRRLDGEAEVKVRSPVGHGAFVRARDAASSPPCIEATPYLGTRTPVGCLRTAGIRVGSDSGRGC
jgi:AmiR/NasT family two-component response regulator